MADLGALLGAAGIGGTIGQAIVRLELDTSKYLAELKSTQAQTVGETRGMGTAVQGFSANAALAFTAVATAAVAFGAATVKAAMEAQKVMAQTKAVIESTGGVANVTADHVVDLANRLRDLSGADDEAIQSSENLLLTFTAVRNEAGKGNDIFDQTEKAILDMATAMNHGAVPSMEDMHKTTIMVGKALNDPILGLTSLSRVGVRFTTEMKEQIKTMVESGDVMGAQKLILKELTTEFGGAAKAAGDTFAGKLAILQSHVEDLMEGIGVLLIPVLEDAIDALENVVTVLAFAIRGFKDFDEAVQHASGSLAEGELKVASWAEQFAGHIPFIGEAVKAYDRVTASIDAVGGSTERHIGVIEQLSTTIREQAIPAYVDYQEAASLAAKGVTHFAGMSGKILTDWSTGVKTSFHDAVFALRDFTTESDITKTDVVVAFREMKQEARRTANAMTEISHEKWINEDFRQFISEQAPGWLIGFAELSKKQQQKIQEDFGATTEFTKKFNAALETGMSDLDRLNKGSTRHKVVIEYDYVGFDPSKPGMSAGQTGGGTRGQR